MTLFEMGKKSYNTPTLAREVFDVTGAGDCFLAAFVYALAKNYNYEKCIRIATAASTESVKHTGTYVLKLSDVEETVVFTNGCFDILHTGHLELLKYAKTLGSTLVVGVNSDASVKRLKGRDRPVNSELTRAHQLNTLPWVDEVIIFDDDTPYKLIKSLRPDVIVKGGDYTVEQVVGHDLASVVIFPTVEGHSTTKIIEATQK
jgi:D-beta-D-heptose 7-phosphate kinase/D-beta-D-heptose 1-phosphate adenosyltransferase